MKQKITKILIGFAIAIAAFLVFGFAFQAYAEGLPQSRQDDVLVKALPIVARFVAILLVFICLIAIAATILNGRIPHRVHRPIEMIIILGILLGVVGLFQPWQALGYEYGFLLLLFSALGFTMWSHIVPRLDKTALPPLDVRAHVVGLVVAILLAAPVTLALDNATRPTPPYGINPTLWSKLYEGKEKGDVLKAEKEDNHRTMLPVFILVGAMVGGIGYVFAREIAAVALARSAPQAVTLSQPAVASQGH